MAGGLIQLVSYGSQDLYLTGTPEITYFKVVYRRHTNFSTESIRVDFDDTVGFGLENTLTVPKIGDLVHKAYLEIVLPEIDFKRSDASNDLFLEFDEARTNYDIVRSYMSINRRAYVGAFDVFVAENTNDPAIMVNKVDDVFNDVTNELVIQNFKDLLLKPDVNPPFIYDEISMKSIVDSVPDGSDEDTFFNAMNIGVDKSVKLQKFFYDDLINKKDANDDENNDNIMFAWVSKIGHAIIESVEVRIGGMKIDKSYGDWLNIWHELTANRDTEELYKNMIGDVSILTDFNRNVKPQYTLTVPLQFWFNTHSGLAVPLVSLEYHELTFHVKFRKLEDVSYIENGKTVFVTENSDSLFLDEVTDELGVNIEAGIYFDYIYLDSAERRRFAQAGHEYLIEQLQVLEIRDVEQTDIQCVINNFVHPTKELVWVVQKESYTENIDGYTQLRWDNYSLTDDNKGNPVLFSSLDFHSLKRVERLEGAYFNYVQPFEHHSSTPSDGINVYCFSLHPEDHQPSGTANFSRLSRVTLSLELDKTLFDDNSSVIIRIYSRNLNILRFISGMAGLSYTYG